MEERFFFAAHFFSCFLVRSISALGSVAVFAVRVGEGEIVMRRRMMPVI